MCFSGPWFSQCGRPDLQEGGQKHKLRPLKASVLSSELACCHFSLYCIAKRKSHGQVLSVWGKDAWPSADVSGKGKETRGSCGQILYSTASSFYIRKLSLTVKFKNYLLSLILFCPSDHHPK